MSAPRHSESLQAKIGLAYPRLGEVASRFWSHPDLAELYPEFLVVLHTIIRSSVPLLQDAAEAAEGRAPDDPLAEPLAAYYRHHAEEEAGHDDWLLEDLEVLGITRDEVWGRVPPAPVASMVGAQYYWMRHVHPVAFLGYLAVLEGKPPVVEHLEEVRDRTGLPSDAFRTLIRHAKLDPHHRDDLLALIDRLPLAPVHQELLALSAFHTIEQVSLVLREVLEAHGS